MATKKIIGIALILAGAGLLFWGYDIYNSFGSQVGMTFGGNASWEAYAFMAGGLISIVMGILKVK